MEDTDSFASYGRRYKAIKHVLEPFHTYFCCSVFNKLTPGVDWQGCTKSDLWKAYAKGEHDLHAISIKDAQRRIVGMLSDQYGYSVLAL